jgi:IS605 OrfB family transposase
MKLTAKVKLLCTPEQRQILQDTLKEANQACNAISGMAWNEQTFKQYDIHGLVYYPIREHYRLSAQMVVRAISKVADGYKLDQKRKRKFSYKGAFPYDERILTWYTHQGCVSIWTVAGRLRIPYASGEYQDNLLQTQKGQSDLCCIKGEFYLYATCEVDELPEQEVDDAIGVDMGVTNIVVTSDGEIESSNQVEERRRWYQRRRDILQSVGTRSAKRRLKQLAGRQARFQRDVNHSISRRLVDLAQHTHRAIAIEDLSGIRTRTRVRKKQRARHANWAFYQLRQFLAYKCQLAGIPLVLVDPQHTSQECSQCGQMDRRNRRSQERFVFVHCGFECHADLNASFNIRSRAIVNSPMVSDCHSSMNFQSGLREAHPW